MTTPRITPETENEAPADLLAATWDHETETPAGDLLRLTIETDADTSIDDYDHECYGRTEWYRGTNEYGRPTRPEWADGSAEVIAHDHPYRLWWSPPADLPAESRRELRDLVHDLCHYGFHHVHLEMVTPAGDTFDAALGGVDRVDPFIIGDLFAECEAQRVAAVNRAALAALTSWARSGVLA